MDRTDDSRDDPGDETDAGTETETGTGTGTPGRAQPEADRTPAHDRETVESAVEDVTRLDDEVRVEDGARGGNVAGASPGTDLGPVEPGSPTLEGSLFVLLGVALTLVVLAQLVGF